MLTEHRTDGRLERGDVGHHHHDVARGKLRALQPFCKQAQQLVVKDLHFALCVVGDVEYHGAVCGSERRRWTFTHGHQVADAGLHLGQQRPAGLQAGIVEEVDAAIVKARTTLCGAVVFVEQADEVARLPPPARQQRVTMRSQLRQRSPGFRHARAHCVPPGWRLQHFPIREEIRPVMTARVRDGHDDLADLGEFRHGFQRLTRHVGGAEQHQPARESVRPSSARPGLQQLLQKRRMDGGPRQGRGFGRQYLEQVPPQGWLPKVFGVQRNRRPGQTRRPGKHHVFPVRPVRQPVAAVNLILVEEVREALRQLQAAQRAWVLQEPPQRGVGVAFLPTCQKPGKHRHEPPGERLLVQRRPRRDGGRTQHGTIGPPQEAGRQLHADRCAHALADRQLHLQPLAHALALDEEAFFFQRRERVV
ncbi:MAG: hypothetical protein RJB26_596, partial [Pseudomonadota bacterium]